MFHVTREAITRWLDALLHVHDTPKRTAAAFAVGVFFSFSPFLGLQTVSALGCAFLFNLNRVAVFAGLWANLPWIMAPWYTVTTAGAAAVLGTDAPSELGTEIGSILQYSVFRGDFWQRLIGLLQPLAWPFLLGPVAGAGVVAALSYLAALAFIRRAARKEARRPAASR